MSTPFLFLLCVCGWVQPSFSSVPPSIRVNCTDALSRSTSQALINPGTFHVQKAPASHTSSATFSLSTPSLQAILPGVTTKPTNISAIEAPIPIPSITPSPITRPSSHGLQSGVPTICTPSACKVIFHYENVYYWPPSVQNTACLSIEDATSDIVPSGIRISGPSENVVVFNFIHATNGCQQVGNTYADYTHTYHPGELSSYRDGATYSLNLEDLPCPPESVQWTSPGTYAPMIAFPDWMRDLDRVWKTCDVEYEPGIDPFTAIHPKLHRRPCVMVECYRSVERPSGPHNQVPPLLKKKQVTDENGHPHGRRTPRAVASTPTATLVM